MGDKIITVRVVEDDEGETLTVLDGAEEVATVYTSYDCPEDNTVRRLRLPEFTAALIAALGGRAVHVAE